MTNKQEPYKPEQTPEQVNMKCPVSGAECLDEKINIS